MADIDVPQPVASAKPKVSGPTTQRKAPSDFTGRKTEQLNAEKAAERQEAAASVAMVNAPAEIPDVIEVMPIEANERDVPIEVHTAVTDMTWGRVVLDPGDPETGRPAVMGSLNTLNYAPGHRYFVSEDLANHLQNLGYLSYRG